MASKILSIERLGISLFYVASSLEKALCESVDKSANRECREAILSLSRNTMVETAGHNTPKSEDSLTYGEIVQCVDLFMTPEKLIATSMPERNTTKKEEQYRKAMYESPYPKSVKGSRLPYKCRHAFWSFAQASHINHTHFQDELLVSVVTYHTLALAVARQKNLYGALLINAIADHYLQDCFAPGHIISPRASQTDLVSNAMHDWANDTGVDFILRGGDAGGVRAILRQMKTLDSEEDQRNVWCRLTTFNEQRIAEKCDDPMKAVVKQIDSWTMVDENSTVRLKGDKRLWNRKDTADGLPQRLLMIAVNARSILDVLDAYKSECTANTCNHFDETAWAFFIRPQGFAGDEATAGLPFGYYALGENGTPPSNIKGKEEDVTDAANTKEVRDGPTGATVDFHYWYPIVGLSIGRESFSSGSRAGRNTLALEAPVYGWITESEINVGFGIGAIKFQEGGVHGFGYQVRVGAIIPMTETTVTGWVRRLDHEGNAEHGWRNGVGVRIDQGFSSFLSLYVGAGKDYGAIANGPLQRGYVFSAGIMIAAPSSQIKGLFEPATPTSRRVGESRQTPEERR